MTTPSDPKSPQESVDADAPTDERSRRWLVKAAMNLGAVTAAVFTVPKKGWAPPKTNCAPWQCGPGACNPLSCPPAINNCNPRN